jgi:hypothetical protein
MRAGYFGLIAGDDRWYAGPGGSVRLKISPREEHEPTRWTRAPDPATEARDLLMMWLVVAHVTVCLLALISLVVVVAVKALGTLVWTTVESLRGDTRPVREPRGTARPAHDPGITAQGPAMSRFAAFTASVRQHRDA